MAATARSQARLERGVPRSLIAWVAVVATLTAAVVGARAGSNSALALTVATLAGNATDALQSIGEAIPLGFAFGLGMAAAVNPCGFALLPTYLGLVPGDGGRRATPMASAVETSPGGERGHDD